MCIRDRKCVSTWSQTIAELSAICDLRSAIVCDHMETSLKVFCDYSMFITLYKLGEVHFRLLGTNGFYVKAKSERFSVLLRARVVVRISNMKTSRCRLVDYVKTSQQKACRTCSTIVFLHWTNQIIDLWTCRWRCRRQILNSLMNSK